MTVGHHVGKDPRIANQFLIGHAGQHGDRKRHIGKRIEQFCVLDQRNATVIQVLALINAFGIDPAIDADHQVKRQPEFIAQLGQRPEHSSRQRHMMRCVGLFALLQHGF